MKNFGEHALLARILAVGLILLLLFWTLLVQPADAHSERIKPIVATDLFIRSASPDLDFQWQVPPQVALEPQLFNAMRTEADREFEKTGREAAASNRSAREAGLRPNVQVERRNWNLAHMSDALLVLDSTPYSFTGGAHGNSAAAAVHWDRRAKRRISFPELFTDRAAAEALLRPAICRELDRQRAEKRKGQTSALAEFDQCPAPDSFVMRVGGDPVIRSVHAIASPYNAGPYSEGFYDVVIFPDAKLLALVKPEYRESFAKP